jgi:hypothetical protein
VADANNCSGVLALAEAVALEALTLRLLEANSCSAEMHIFWFVFCFCFQNANNEKSAKNF